MLTIVCKAGAGGRILFSVTMEHYLKINLLRRDGIHLTDHGKSIFDSRIAYLVKRGLS